MGQIVNVVERPSSRPGVVRFETNRALSGMGHDRFVAGEPIEDVRPVDELARRIFARGGINAIHINGSVITVDLAKGYTAEGIADIVRGLYTFYLPMPVVAADTVAAEAAVVAAPDVDRAAEAPVLQEIAAAEGAGVERPADPGAEVAARNEQLTAEYEAAQAAAAEAETEPPAADDEAEEVSAEAVGEGPDPAENETARETAERAAEPKGKEEPTDAETEGHGDVVADTAEAPNEAEGTERRSDVEADPPE